MLGIGQETGEIYGQEREKERDGEPKCESMNDRLHTQPRQRQTENGVSLRMFLHQKSLPISVGKYSPIFRSCRVEKKHVAGLETHIFSVFSATAAVK